MVRSLLAQLALDAAERADLEQAVALSLESIAVEETAEAQWNLAIVYDRLGLSAQAQRARARAIELDPSFAASKRSTADRPPAAEPATHEPATHEPPTHEQAP
jgi:tetratricopeptide (TPR) repeat protein